MSPNSVDHCSLKFSDLLCNFAKSSFITRDSDCPCMVNVSRDTLFKFKFDIFTDLVPIGLN